MIKATLINKEIRSKVSPILQAAKFSVINVRENWRHTKEAICVLNIRAVGGHFSTVTGWPGQSLLCHIGIYFPFFPAEMEIKSDPKMGNTLSPGVACQLRFVLETGIDQTNFTYSLSNPAECRRQDIYQTYQASRNSQVP